MDVRQEPTGRPESDGAGALRDNRPADPPAVARHDRRAALRQRTPRGHRRATPPPPSPRMPSRLQAQGGGPRVRVSYEPHRGSERDKPHHIPRSNCGPTIVREGVRATVPIVLTGSAWSSCITAARRPVGTPYTGAATALIATARSIATPGWGSRPRQPARPRRKIQEDVGRNYTARRVNCQSRETSVAARPDSAPRSWKAPRNTRPRLPTHPAASSASSAAA